MKWPHLPLTVLLILLSSFHRLWAIPLDDSSSHNSSNNSSNKTFIISSKLFTESIILGEMLTLLAESVQQPVSHYRELGGTRIVWNALVSGEIDAYVDYSGTLEQEILRTQGPLSHEALRAAVNEFGLRLSKPLGFNNTYALGVNQQVAESLKLQTISQLKQHPELKFGFGLEFMDRADGWPGLQKYYQLPQQNVTGLEHELAYRALDSGDIHMTELYSTDAEIAYYNLYALEDDLGFFPAYEAMIVYRAELAESAPELLAQWSKLEGAIDASTMSQMNAAVKLEGAAETQVAQDFLSQHLGIQFQSREQTLKPWQKIAQGIWQRTLEHLELVAISLGLALLIALPLGVLAAKRARVGQVILSICGILQTIPSLAVFVFLIPLLGIGGPPAVAALFLYSLLPIVRNTHAGITQIPASLVDSAHSLGLSSSYRLRRIELPLASPTILAGIQTAAVINVGTATLAALIGAGGYGQPILTGIRLDDFSLIMQGAGPAALLALLAQAFFHQLERLISPQGVTKPGTP